MSLHFLTFPLKFKRLIINRNIKRIYPVPIYAASFCIFLHESLKEIPHFLSLNMFVVCHPKYLMCVIEFERFPRDERKVFVTARLPEHIIHFITHHCSTMTIFHPPFPSKFLFLLSTNYISQGG